jgi:hypothetical protein
MRKIRLWATAAGCGFYECGAVVRALLLVGLLGCGTKDQAAKVECGKGTVLRNGVCEVAVPIAVDAASARVIDAGVKTDADAPDVRPTWTYSTNADAMRGVTSELAMIESTTELEFSPPYGRTHLVIFLRHDPPGALHVGDTVIIGVEHGQFDCRSDNCTINYKVDTNKVAPWPGEETRTSSGAIILEKNGEWISKIRGGTHLVIESGFFHEGRRQFEFNISGLNWKYPIVEPPKPAAAEPKEPKEPTQWCYDFIGGTDGLCFQSAEECERYRSGAAGAAAKCQGR